MNARLFLVVCDYNDADYSSGIVEIEEEDFQKFLPLLKAINDFQPYISKHGAQYNNWEGNRPDLGEKTAEEVYSQFPPGLIEEFREKFLCIPNPVAEYVRDFHTIVNIQEITLGKQYVDGEYKTLEGRNREKIEAYWNEHNEIYSYRRPSDGKPLNCIPFSEMTEEENELIRRADSLYLKYQ